MTGWHCLSTMAARAFSTSAEGRVAEAGGPLAYFLVAASVVLVLAVACLCGKYLLRPGEQDARHIKRRALWGSFDEGG